jgi:hypothetical protein
MKQILFLFSALLLSASAIFAQNSSNLVVFSEDAAPFYLMLNGIRQNALPQTNIKVTGITSQSNALLIIFEDNSLGTLKQNIHYFEMGVEATVKIVTTKKGMKLRFFGEVPISEANSNAGFTTNYQTTNAVPAVQPSQPITTQPVQPVVTQPEQPVVTQPTQPVITEQPQTNPTISPSTTQPTQPVRPVQPVQPVVSNQGVNLMYNWISGKSYRFSVNQTDDVNTSMMGMNINERFNINTVFEMFISSVAANGDASGVIYVLSYTVKDSRGSVLATINDLPLKAVKSEFKVDRKGNFTFPYKITLITSAQGNVLAYGKADGTSVQAGGQAGDMRLDAYAEFDPVTGKLKTGYTFREGQPLKQVTVKMDENSDVIDVLPYDYLDLLALPDGIINQGDMAKVNAGIYQIDILAKSISNGTAQMNYKMSSDKNKSIIDSKTEVKTQNSSVFMDMDVESMMDITKEDKQAMDISKSMMPNIDCDFDSFFNYNEGMFSSVNGIMTTTINAMGMKMQVKSNLQMKKI